jgi:GT2 family glycosyltransferase
MKAISIIIVNWNSGFLLKECIESVLQFSEGYVKQIILIDNASADGSLLLVPENSIITIVRNKINKGFGAACNQGYALSTAKYILLLNPDTRILADTLRTCVSFMDTNSSISIVGAMHEDENRKIQPSCSRFPTFRDYITLSLGLNHIAPRLFRSPVLMYEYDYSRPGKVDQVMGAFMFIRKAVVDKLGYFMDERFFVYLEDVDFSKRVSIVGGISYYEPSIKIYHKGNGTTENIKGIRLYYNLESRLKYINKYFKKRNAFILFFLTLFVEPFTRMINVLIHFKGSEAKEVVKGYGLLYRKLTQF